jgi:FtsH-binding integral membrane protein
MSYAMEQPIAIRAAESARAAFIRRTYAHLAGAVLAFVAVEAVLMQLPGIRQIAIAMTGGFNWLFVLGAFMGVSWLANMWAQSETSRGVQYAGLAVYTVAQAILFIPLMYVATRYYPNAIPTAAILTAGLFGGLTLTVFTTRKDFSFLRPILMIGSLLALGFVIAAIIFGFSLGLVFCFAMVALISGFILYDTSNVLHHYRTDQYVAASLALFSSVAILFWYILQIVMSAQGRD